MKEALDEYAPVFEYFDNNLTKILAFSRGININDEEDFIESSESTRNVANLQPSRTSKVRKEEPMPV